MAMIGLKYPVVGKYAESGGTVSHTAGMVLAKAIQASISINQYSVTLYADDGLAESEKGFQDGTVDLNVDDLSQEAAKFIFGATETAGEVQGDETTKALLFKGDDDVPDVGLGFYAPRKKGGVRSYRAIFFPRVKFGYPNETLDTKGEQVTFGTPTIQGTIQLDATGEWKREITVADEAKAVTWLKTQAGIT